MAEDPNVVTDTTEDPSPADPSSVETQTEGSEQPPENQTPQEKIDWRRKQREDAELNAHVQSEIARARTRWQRQQLREHAKAATAANDPNYSRYVAQQVAAEQDEPDEGDAAPHDADWARAADRVQPQLERLLQLDGEGRATNPYYVALHQRLGRAAMDKRYAEDPVGFVSWVDDQIMEMRVDEKVKKVAPSLAGAMAQDEAHSRLRGMPTPIGGSASANGALTLERYEGMTFDERQKLRKENPRAIDEMIARAAR